MKIVFPSEPRALATGFSFCSDPVAHARGSDGPNWPRWLCILTLCAIGTASIAADPARGPLVGHKGMVVSVCPVGSEAGASILRKGGNAADAAIATAFALAVTYPAAGNIGGGGFMMIHPTPGAGAPRCIEYRETAPALAKADMFAQKADWYASNAIGTPGTVRGLELAYQKFGSKKLTWAQLVAPAIALARDGFKLDPTLASSLNSVVAGEEGELRRCLGKPGGGDWSAGDTWKQPDLARTLQRIAEQGAAGFYAGETADLFEKQMIESGGLIRKSDLAAYTATDREPTHGTYRGYDVYGPPPPSSGGICLVEMLNVLETFDVKANGPNSAPTLHLLAETMRRAFLDRARHLGDPAFAAPPAHLTTKEYAKTLAAGIDLNRATKSDALAPDIALSAAEGDSTTHFSIVDAAGMAVSNTYTLEKSYGSRVIVKGAGFILNNEMLDFNWAPGKTARDGRIGTPPNVVAPGKRMLSSQTPTIVAKDGKPFLVTGSPGSRTIINTTLRIVTGVIDYGMDVQAAVDAPRLHHAWMPDEIRLEEFPGRVAVVRTLEAKGHRVARTTQGDGHSILIDPKSGERRGAADHRLHGGAVGE